MRNAPRALATILLAALVAAAACAEDAGALRRMAASSVLELYADPASAQIAVRDLRNGFWWRSNPVTAADAAALPAAVCAAAASSFQLSFTDVDMRVVYSADDASPEVTRSVTPRAGGVEVAYEVRRDPASQASRAGYSGVLGFTVRYLLEGDSLVVQVPEAGVREEGELRLVSLQLLPFLGANRLSDNGYLLVPDGCGALLRFRPATPAYPANLNLAVYGEETFPFSPVRKALGSLSPKEAAQYLRAYSLSPQGVPLPAFGMVREGAGFVAIVGPGDEEARIRCGLSGYTPNFNRIGTEFVFRTPFTAFLSREQVAERFTKERVAGDRAVRYCFLPGSGTGWIDLAARCREQLMAEGMRRSAAATTGLELRVFCGVERRSLLASVLVRATTFAEARSILDAARATVIGPIRLTLVGWERDGFLEGLPRKLPPARGLGGERGMRDLIAYAHALGVTVLLEADYLQATRGGFSRRTEVIRDASGVPITDGLGGYLLAPKTAFERFAAAESGTMAGFGIDGVVLRNLGRMLFADRSDLQPFSRAQAAAWWRRIADSYHGQGLQVALDGANRLLLDVADGGVYDIPLHASGYRYADEEVPFLPVVLHGLVPYAAAALNTAGDPRAAALRALECGAAPSLELTAADPVILRDTRRNILYRSQFRDVLASEGELLARIVRETAGFAGKFITGHRALAAGVYLTSYEGGGEVVVNYTNDAYSWEGRTVAPLDFLARGTP